MHAIIKALYIFCSKQSIPQLTIKYFGENSRKILKLPYENCQI